MAVAKDGAAHRTGGGPYARLGLRRRWNRGCGGTPSRMDGMLELAHRAVRVAVDRGGPVFVRQGQNQQQHHGQ